jgi:hypothetical protein
LMVKEKKNLKTYNNFIINHDIQFFSAGTGVVILLLQKNVCTRVLTPNTDWFQLEWSTYSLPSFLLLLFLFFSFSKKLKLNKIKLNWIFFFPFLFGRLGFPSPLEI